MSQKSPRVTAAGFEDPVTGSLNAGIAQWLIGNGIAPPSYIASQGAVLGREERVHVEQVECKSTVCPKGELRGHGKRVLGLA